MGDRELAEDEEICYGTADGYAHGYEARVAQAFLRRTRIFQYAVVQASEYQCAAGHVVDNLQIPFTSSIHSAVKTAQNAPP